MHIVSFDPGETTGCCVGVWEEDYGRDFGITHANEVFWGERFLQVKRILNLYKPEYIVVESFLLYPHAAESQIGKDFPSVQMIGIIKTYAYEMGMLDHVHMQPAYVRKGIKILPHHRDDLYGVHVQDAYQHLRYFVIVQLPKLVA